ncbi:hypothetical protein AK812_SmicGene48151, partial [Symbiodinium microadriaticum]
HRGVNRHVGAHCEGFLPGSCDGRWHRLCAPVCTASSAF